MDAAYIEFSAKGVVAVRTEKLSTDALQPWETLVRNEATLVSAGTELSALHGRGAAVTYPRRTGYAAVGRIVAKGAAVDDFREGDRVFYAGKHCSAQRFLHGQDHEWGRLYPCPPGIPAADAPFGCLGRIALTAPAITQLDLGDTVAVFGLGLVGNLAAQLYQQRGARVIGLDPVRKRCEIARACGIDTVLDVPPRQQVEAVKDLTNGAGAQVTVDAAGHSSVITSCVKAAALCGQVVLLGTPRVPVTMEATEMFNDIHTRCLRMLGAHMWQFPAHDLRGAKQTVASLYRTVFDLIGTGRLKTGPLRSHFVTPAHAAEMYDGLERKQEEYWGVVFDWSA
ncbi:zinc-binding alcohol dehydrogenase [bacterium]|nr:zinc-binding alcohol dehydrogenase [bacterium]